MDGEAAPKMGGKPVLHLLVIGGPDLSCALWGGEEPESRPRHLQGLLDARYEGAFRVEATFEPMPRSDVLLQALAGTEVPEELRPLALVDADLVRRLSSAEPDVVAISVQPDIINPGWRHRGTGYLAATPPAPSEDGRDQTEAPEGFAPLGLLDPDASQANLQRLIRTVKERWGAHLVLLNCSSIDPADQVHTYFGRDDTLAVRIHRFNLALIALSASEGVSVVDVDRIIAELGGDRHVPEALRYSDPACREIAEEFLRVLEDLGFFDERPLVPQIGRDG